MKHINISHLFGDGKIICLEDVDFKAKSNDPAGFEKALSLLGIAASNVLVVEDMPSNLVHAKKLGLTTALVHNEKPPAEAMEYVDLVYETTLDLVRDVLNLGPRHDYSIGFSPS